MNNQNKPTGLGALAQRVIIATEEVKRMKRDLEEKEELLRAAKEAMQAAFASNGVTSVKYRGYTVYVHESTFGSLVSQEPEGDEDPKSKAIAALKNNDLGWMVKETVASQTLSAWVREQEVDKATGMPRLPEALAPHIKVSKKLDVRSKQS